MHMCDCPKFDSCSAPICPLDQDWRKRAYLDGERICIYLTEYSKVALRANLRGVLSGELYKSVSEQAEAISEAYPRIKKQLLRSSISNSKLNKVVAV